jgi:hypothetical protein
MGLFGFIGKAVGKIARAGLSVATHGLSDKVINGARAVLGAKPKAANMVPYAGTSTAQERALMNKIGTLTPRVRVTERSEGWSFKSKPAYKTKRRTRTPRIAPQRAIRPAAASKPRGTRKPPSGGLDLSAMAAAWKAAGKPMAWQAWIKTNPLRKA